MIVTSPCARAGWNGTTRQAGQGTAWRGMMTSDGERSFWLVGRESRALADETFNPRRSVKETQATD